MESEVKDTKPQGTRWFGWFLVAVIVAMASIIVVQRTSIYGKKDKHTIELTEANFNTSIENGVILIDVWAEWCKPCKAMEPAIQAVAKEMQGRAFVGKLDADKNRQLAEQLGIEVLPTLLIYKDGKEVDRLFGMQTQETLTAALEAILNQPAL